MKKSVWLFLKGFAMGVAEVIPGVSGGTIALITGIYTRFINAIRSIDLAFIGALFTSAFWRELVAQLKDPTPRDITTPTAAETLAFFVVLGAGMVLAILISIRIIPVLLVQYPEPMNGFFLGLILASILIP